MTVPSVDGTVDHDMWWLEGRTHMKHKNDKRALVRRVVASMVGDILNGSLVAAYLHTIGDVPILFTHAGVGSKFYGFVQTQLQSSARSQLSGAARPIDPKQIEKYANDMLVRSIEGCSDKFPCRYFVVVVDVTTTAAQRSEAAALLIIIQW